MTELTPHLTPLGPVGDYIVVRSQWGASGGTYEGIKASEHTGEPVHFFVDGFIKDTPQTCHAFPTDRPIVIVDRPTHHRANARAIAIKMAAQLSALHYTYSQIEILLGNEDGAREFQQTSAQWHSSMVALRDDWTDPTEADMAEREREVAAR